MIRNVTKRLARRRPGTVYVTVLIVALAVALMAASAARVAKVHLRGIGNTHRRHVARLLAISAIDHALVKFNNEPTWETNYTLDTEYPATPVTANGGSFTWKLVDRGNGQKRLDGIGRVGDAACVLSVNLGAAASEGLSVPLLCGGNLRLSSGTVSTLNLVDGPACSNGDLANYGTIDGDVEAQTESVVGTVTGTKTIPGTLRALPEPSTVFDYYMANGTDITSAVSANSNVLSDCLLSPNANTFGGGIDPDGIYIINLPGISVTVENVRIVGTLIVRVPGDKLNIKKENIWEPARANWPALLVEGDLELRQENADVSESDIGINLNPAGTPWQGNTDTDSTDTYPSAIAGIIYATGNITFDGSSSGYGGHLYGSVICGGSCVLQALAEPTITYDNAAALDPPPGFGAGDSSSIVGGSWRQTASP